ncbi:MAG: hypothetical protein ABIP03_07950, partial [Aquihabitans sp.]
MPPPITIEDLDDHRLAGFYDQGSLARGRAYAQERRITVLGSEPGSINAVCIGSERATYVVRIRWHGRRDLIDLRDSCSCPLGGACKHCVATILTVRRQATAAGPAAVRAPDTGAWRRALADLAITEDAADDPPRTRLALCLTVQRPTPSRYAPNAEPRVTIRPMRWSRAGRWVKTGASWRDIESPYSHELAEVDVFQRSALRSLMASGRISYYSGSAAPSLDQFGPDLWHQLKQAVQSGVELITDRPGDIVELSPAAATVSID